MVHKASTHNSTHKIYCTVAFIPTAVRNSLGAARVSSRSPAELADGVAAESKCRPFFDFHIDLEREGSLLCLRLAGEEGTKPFIRVEFQPAKQSKQKILADAFRRGADVSLSPLTE